MKNQMKRTLWIGQNVILLTILYGCAAVSNMISPSDDDPITKTARHEAQKGHQKNETLYPTPTAEVLEKALSSHEIFLGMTMKEVLISWGHPREIQNAGDSKGENQRWIYQDGLTYGLNLQPPRIVYFEKGQVVGWENAKNTFSP